MIIEFPAAGNSPGNSFGIGADSAILETIDAVVPVACGKFPTVAAQGMFSPGAGNFPGQGSDFFGSAGNSPFVTGVTKSSRVSRGNSLNHFGLSALSGHRYPTISDKA
jgi:hypothetical protein